MIKFSQKWLLIAPILLSLAGCGATEEKPLRDNPFDRTMGVADEALFYDRLQQAAVNYQKSFDYAVKGDSITDINDAGYNLAVVQLGMNDLQKALKTVHSTRNELSVRGDQNSPQLDLVDATILYRMKRLSEAKIIVQRAEDSDQEDISERTLFLLGLIASDQGNLAQLIDYSQKLDKLLKNSNEKDISAWHADQNELHALISYQQNQYALAITSANAAEKLRREYVDYRGMIRALIVQAKANEKMQNNVAAAQFYLRAGQSAGALKDYDDAKLYLNKVMILRADHLTYTMASDQLKKVILEQKKQKEN